MAKAEATVEQGNTKGSEFLKARPSRALPSCTVEFQAKWRLAFNHGSEGKRNETEVMCMALTRDLKETVVARAKRDPAFAQALLDEALTLFLNGEPETAKRILRDLVNATVGFETLSKKVHKSSESLHRMLSKSGNPTMENLSAILVALKKTLHILEHRPGPAAAREYEGVMRSLVSQEKACHNS